MLTSPQAPAQNVDLKYEADYFPWAFWEDRELAHVQFHLDTWSHTRPYPCSAEADSMRRSAQAAQLVLYNRHLAYFIVHGVDVFENKERLSPSMVQANSAPQMGSEQ